MKKIFLSRLLFLAMFATANTAFTEDINVGQFNFLMEVTGITCDYD